MIKFIVFLALLTGVLYFTMGENNDPKWTQAAFPDHHFAVEFPGEGKPSKRKLPSVDCLVGDVHSVSSRHGPFKMNGVLTEIGVLGINYIIFGCKLTTEGAFNYFRQMSKAKFGGEVVSEKEIKVDGYPGREVVIKAGFEDSIVVRRIFSPKKGDLIILGMTYPQRVDYKAWADRYFNSFHFTYND